MKCARLHLQERFKSKVKPEACYSSEKPRRYCQKRMVNPEHEEDPRWADVYGRFHCLEENDNINDVTDSGRGNPEPEDLFLSVQTLKFQGNIEQPKRYRSSFKYKSPSVGDKHRMFVKQVITYEDEDSDDGRSSLTSYYIDDYVKYLYNNEKSRPTSGKSSLNLQSFDNNMENKATQVDKSSKCNKKSRHEVDNSKILVKKCDKKDDKNEYKSNDADIEDTKISFHKSGRRRSLTISRIQSPEIMQVIRVNVVCNQNRASIMSDYEENKKPDETLANLDIESKEIKKSHFADKYLLTNTIKTLDENLAGGEKVTLLCKTFKLTERSKVPLSNKPTSKTNNKKSAPKYKGLQLLQDEVSKMIYRFNNR